MNTLKNLTILKLFIFLSVIFSSTTLFAYSPLKISKTDNKIELGHYIKVYEDKTSNLTISDILELTDKFNPIKNASGHPSLGYTKSSYWILIDIFNTENRAVKWYLEQKYAIIDKIDFYYSQNKIYKNFKSGDARPFHLRPIKTRTIVFPVTSTPGKNRYFIKIKTAGTMVLALNYWNIEKFYENVNYETLFLWFFIGIFIAVAIYNLFIFRTTKEWSYFYLTFFSISMALFTMIHYGLAFQFLWPNATNWASRSNPFFIILLTFWAILFIRSYLNTAKNSPKLDKVLKGATIFNLFLLSTPFFIEYIYVTQISMLIFLTEFLIVIFTGIFLHFRKIPQAKYFLYAWTLFLFFSLVTIGRSFGLLPLNLFTNWSFHLGSSLLVIILSSGISYKISLIQKEKNIAVSALQESESKYRTLVENIQEGIMLIVDKKPVYANQKMVEMTALTREEFFNKNLMDFFPDTEKGKELVSKMYEDRISGINKTSQYEAEIYSSSNKIIPVLISATVIEYEGQKGSLSIITDLSDRKKTENLLVQSQKMEIIGTLASGLAHDFNNALGGIIGSLSLLKHDVEEKGASDEIVYEYADIIERSANRAKNIVSQLLTLSRKQEIELTPVDLNDTIRHIIKIAKNSFDKSIKLNVEYFEKPAMINADPVQIEQILLNFSINAEHSMTLMRNKKEKWGGELSISIDKISADNYFIELHPEAKPGQWWNISVSDTGVGMNKDIIDNIFNPFFTTKDKGVGTGLGLSIVYNLLKQHNGFVDTYSEPGIGSTFKIYLPVAENLSNNTEHHTKKKIGIKGEGLILIVDDEDVILNVATKIVKSCGYDVLQAKDGKEALTIFKEKHKEIDAVVLDMLMPKLSGKDTFFEFKKIDPKVKVLISSGYKHDSRVEEVLKNGAKDFLQKPYTLEKLAEKLHEIVNNP